ncbi:MAG: ATP-binding protein [Anaerolineae bacterium]
MVAVQIAGPQGQVMSLGENALSQSLLIALERRYLYGVAQLGLKPVDADPDLMANVRFLRVTEVAHSQDVARSLHPLNMQNVLSSFRDGSHSLAFVVAGQGSRTHVYMGLYKSDRQSPAHTADYIGVLGAALHGNYPGIRLEPLGPREISSELLRPIASRRQVGAITGIPSLKSGSDDVFVQGLERLTNSLRGEDYSLVVIAEPIGEAAVDDVIQRSRNLASEIHAYVRGTLTDSRGQTSSRADQRGGSIGGGLLVAGGSLLGGMLGFGPLLGAAAPILTAVAGSAGFSMGRTDTTGETRTMGSSREVLNKTAAFCEEILDSYIDRLQQGKNLGFWNVGAFFLADDENTMHRGQGVIRAVLSGDSTYFEPMRALDLSAHDEIVRDALMQFRNPEVQFPEQAPHPLGPVFQQLATPLNTAELSLIMGFPHEEVPGVRLMPIADFGLNPPSGDGFALGQVLYRGEVLEDRFYITPKSLTKHTFITGITGSGKTNTCLALLRAAYEGERVPFLVIEPAKQEYRVLLADPIMGRELQIFTLGDETTSPFRLNPFQFVRGYPLLTHIDLLKAVFNSSFPMYASMPYILEEAILSVYTDRGWDLASSQNRYIGPDDDYTPYLPTMEDLYKQIDVVVERKRYGQQLSQDISAALKARIKSLLIGGKGLMLNCRQSYPLELLLNRPTVLELKNVGDDAEKAFLMALLLIDLYEYCETSRSYGGGLQHLTLIEESHRLLKNIPAVLSSESANPRGKAVEMFTDILAEIREYGEGFVIVDQVPAKLTPDALKNTNLKVLHRIVAEDDRESVGNAMNLTAAQKEHIVRLRVGQAVVHNEYLDKPMLLQVHAVKDNLRERFDREVGREGLLRRMAAFQGEVRDIHRRWPGCADCDAPCTYLSELNAPATAEYEAFQTFVDSLLLGTPQGARREWVHADGVLAAGLRKRYHGGELAPGVRTCAVVQLAHLALHERLGYYDGGIGGYRSYIRMEGLLTTASLGMVPAGGLSEATTGAILDLIEEMRRQVALEPRRREPGCDLCRRPCWYGFMVQRDLPAKAKALAARLKVAADEPDFVGNFPRLISLVRGFAQDVTPFPVAPGHLQHLAYCYLVNSGAQRQYVLRGFQEGPTER